MRSLSPLALALAPLPLPPAALAPDPESAALFVAAESPAPPGVRVDLFVLAPPSPPQLLASFTAPLASFHSPPHSPPETLALHYLPDERSLVIILAGGDIATLALDNPHVRLFFFSSPPTDTSSALAQVEVVGSVDSGIKAAAWSPDDEQIILVTGEDTLVCMTRNFDVVHEEPLRSKDFGHGASHASSAHHPPLTYCQTNSSMSDGDPSRPSSTALSVNLPPASPPTPPAQSPTRPTTASPSSLSVATPPSSPSPPSTRTPTDPARQDARSGYTRATPRQVSSPNCPQPLKPSPGWNPPLRGDPAGTSSPPWFATATKAAEKVDKAGGMSPCWRGMDCAMADSS